MGGEDLTYRWSGEWNWCQVFKCVSANTIELLFKNPKNGEKACTTESSILIDG